MTNKIKIFLGSAKEALSEPKFYVESLQSTLLHQAQVLGWFGHTARPKDFEIFVDKLREFAFDVDGAVFIADADDVLKKRNKKLDVCRDNVLFEIALFIGILGKERVFVVSPKNAKLEWPSDIATLIPKNFDPPQKNTSPNLYKEYLESSMQIVASEIISQINKLGKITKKTNTIALDECHSSWQVVEQKQELFNHNTPVKLSKNDVSNLFFLFFSPTDCEKAYVSIQEFCELYKQKYSCSLEAGYDLQGTWDLLIRVRISKDTNAFFESLYLHLLEHSWIEKDNASPFSRWRIIDVQQRAATFADFDKSIKNKRQISQLFLTDNNEYHQHRANRSFILIDTNGSKSGENQLHPPFLQPFLDSLSRSITDQTGNSMNIIEAISIGKHEIILETFSTCAQSSAINTINRAIAPLLASKRLQKYTLSCYAYREEGLKSKGSKK